MGWGLMISNVFRRRVTKQELPECICSICHAPCNPVTAHLHQGEYIGDECCWDDRMKASE